MDIYMLQCVCGSVYCSSCCSVCCSVRGSVYCSVGLALPFNAVGMYVCIFTLCSCIPIGKAGLMA